MRPSLVRRLRDGEADRLLALIYGPGAAAARRRLASLARHQADGHSAARGSEAGLFRAPGRTELGGNHTDHNHGLVLAAAVDRDIAAAAVRTDDRLVTLASPAYGKPIIIDISDTRPRKSERHSTAALVRGVACHLRAAVGRRRIGGFQARIDSTLPVGAGLSSSAAFELLLGTIWNELYGLGLTPLELAVVGQRAENGHYGKPCGLMDQIASVTGGAVVVDFRNPAAPLVKSVPFDPAASGHVIFLVATGGDHAGLTPLYAAVPAEMKAVAARFGKTSLRAVSEHRFRSAVASLRKNPGDRAILRAMHFFSENRRVREQVDCLARGDGVRFLELVRASRDSSWELLQNCVRPDNVPRQGLALGLALADDFLAGLPGNAGTGRPLPGAGRPLLGASRVHGGGFEGTIQCYVPKAHSGAFQRRMESVFGKGSAIPLRLCPRGALRIL